MSDERAKPRRAVRRQRSIYQVHYALQRRSSEDMTPLPMPWDSLELQAFGLQVAGHKKSDDTKFTGLLQCNATVLKPLLKESQKREVEFYNRLASTTNRDLVELRGYVPRYYGCRKFTYQGHEQDYIILEDLTQRMLEQCVMDVKIGKITYDPLATEEKIKSEQSKYARCKQQYGFCIPGYQVRRLGSGKLLKFGKDAGKRLHGRMVREAIRNYLNGGVGAPLCRALLLQFLSRLWQIQQWARRQRAVRLYAASLLLVYDAARLRDCCGDKDELPSRSACRTAAVTRRRSTPSLQPSASFSGQMSPRGPLYRKLAAVPLTPAAAARDAFTAPPALKSAWTDALDKLHTSHSFEHNYEDKLSKIKMSYRAMLDELSSDAPNPNPWATVKIIDFAHAFFNEEDDATVDENFRQGIDSFVEILEEFLKETDDLS